MIRLLALLLVLSLPFSAIAAPAPARPPLSAAQRDWLGEHAPLRVGVVLQAPYAELDRRRQLLSGLNVELMNQLAALLQLRLSWRQGGFRAAEANLSWRPIFPRGALL
jgi:hypothetical protein